MATVGCPLLGLVRQALCAQLEAGARVRKLAKLRLEKDVQVSTSAGFGAGRQAGRAGSSVGELSVWLAMLGGHQLLWIKVCVLGTKLE